MLLSSYDLGYTEHKGNRLNEFGIAIVIYCIIVLILEINVLKSQK